MPAKPQQHPAGVILLITILIVGTVLLSAAIFSSYIFGQIRTSRLVDQSIQSRYRAESGIERALYQLRKREGVLPADCVSVLGGTSCDSSTGYCLGLPDSPIGPVGNGNSIVSCITADNGALATPWQVVGEKEEVFAVYLPVAQVTQLDLFDPYQQTDPTGEIPSGIRSIGIEWGDANHQADLYYTLTKLNSVTGSQEVEKGIIPTQDCVGLPTCVLDFRHVLNVNPNFSYLLRVQALDFLSEPVGPLRISVYPQDNLAGTPLPLASRYLLRATGQVGRSVIQVSVRTPARAPLSGLYDFVLFSEAEVTK